MDDDDLNKVTRAAMEARGAWLESHLAGLLAAGTPQQDIGIQEHPGFVTRIAVRGRPVFEFRATCHATEGAPPAPSMWQPIETAPKGVKVIVCGTIPGYGHLITTIARYWPEYTLEVAEGYEDEDWVNIGDSGTAYMPADWYEEFHSDEGPAVNLRPTHWMPLPPPPNE